MLANCRFKISLVATGTKQSICSKLNTLINYLNYKVMWAKTTFIFCVAVNAPTLEAI